jgi:hypothetical protein
MVLRAIPVIRDTAAIPPQPAANASLVAKTRRCRSSRYGPSVSYRRRIAASLITTLRHKPVQLNYYMLNNPIRLFFYAPLVKGTPAIDGQGDPGHE